MAPLKTVAAEDFARLREWDRIVLEPSQRKLDGRRFAVFDMQVSVVNDQVWLLWVDIGPDWKLRGPSILRDAFVTGTKSSPTQPGDATLHLVIDDDQVMHAPSKVAQRIEARAPHDGWEIKNNVVVSSERTLSVAAGAELDKLGQVPGMQRRGGETDAAFRRRIREYLAAGVIHVEKPAPEPAKKAHEQLRFLPMGFGAATLASAEWVGECCDRTCAFMPDGMGGWVLLVAGTAPTAVHAAHVEAQLRELYARLLLGEET